MVNPSVGFSEVYSGAANAPERRGAVLVEETVALGLELAQFMQQLL